MELRSKDPGYKNPKGDSSRCPRAALPSNVVAGQKTQMTKKISSMKATKQTSHRRGFTDYQCQGPIFLAQLWYHMPPNIPKNDSNIYFLGIDMDLLERVLAVAQAVMGKPSGPRHRTIPGPGGERPRGRLWRSRLLRMSGTKDRE